MDFLLLGYILTEAVPKSVFLHYPELCQEKITLILGGQRPNLQTLPHFCSCCLFFCQGSHLNSWVHGVFLMSPVCCALSPSGHRHTFFFLAKNMDTSHPFPWVVHNSSQLLEQMPPPEKPFSISSFLVAISLIAYTICLS